jgi:hypothetical protein
MSSLAHRRPIVGPRAVHENQTDRQMRARVLAVLPAASSWLCPVILSAQFAADSVVGTVVSDIPNIELSTDGQSDFEAQIGSGEGQ